MSSKLSLNFFVKICAAEFDMKFECPDEGITQSDFMIVCYKKYKEMFDGVDVMNIGMYRLLVNNHFIQKRLLTTSSFQNAGIDEELGSVKITLVPTYANYSLFENQKPDLKAFLLQVSSALSSSSASSSSSSSLSLSSNSRSPSPAEHALILENATTLLSSPVAAVSEDAKQLVLSVLYDLVDARIMNQTAEYVVWRQSGAVPSGGAGAGVGAESIKGDIAPSIRFSKAFADFTDVVQKLSQSKKGSLLTFAAERMYRSIQENKFFPTSVLLTFEQLTAVHLPRKFLTNTALSSVSHSSNKLIFNGSDGNYTFCLDHPLLKSGLYKMIIVVNRNSASALWGSPGLTTKTFSGSYGNSLLEEGAGSCCLNNDSLYCGGSTVASYTSFSRSGGRVTLAVELDASRHVAYYSADTKQVPYCVVDIPVDARFAISGYYKGTSIELQSLTKLRAPTTITLEYKPLIWK